MSDFTWDEVISIEQAPEDQCYDISLIDDGFYLDEPNFIANGFVVHNCGMHDHYVERKRGKEYAIHPILEPILGKTHACIIYQEQIMQILNIVGDIPLKDCYVVIKAVAKKKVKLFKPYKEQFLAVGKERLSYTDQEITKLWQQLENFSEYGFNRSHAVSYCYLSARLLYLKANYPLEFYAATLKCEKDQIKIKIYKTEAEMHGVLVRPIDLNKSKELFEIIGEEVYFGFSNIKGIGREVAKRIVENQPYSGLQDFLERFGTEMKVVKPLIGLRVFGNIDPVILYKFYEFYKETAKKRNNRRKGFAKTMEKMKQKLKYLLPEQMHKYAEFKEVYFQKWYEAFDKDEEKVVQLRKLWKIYERAISSYEAKNAAEDKLTLESFNADEWLLEDKVIEELRDIKECEELSYGFPWHTNIEESPDYCGGHTFADFKIEVEAGASVFSVEVEVEEVQRKQSKNNKDFWYHQIITTDANGEMGYVTVWEEDWKRWEEEMVVGNLLKIMVAPPTGSYKTYTFFSPPKYQRHKLIPKEKNQDLRLIVMEQPKRAKKQVTDAEMLDKMGECKI